MKQIKFRELPPRKNGNCSINRIPEREPYFRWIKVVGQIGNGFISLKSKDFKVSNLNAVKYFVIAVVRDGYANAFMLENGFVADKNFYVVANLEQQVSLLLNGKVDFLFTDIESVKYNLMQQHIDPNLLMVNLTQKAWNRDLYLAANPDSAPQLLQRLHTQTSNK